MEDNTRRKFIKTSASAVGAALLWNTTNLFAANASAHEDLNVSIFSKHLQFLNYKNMAEAAKEVGFDGVDLTIRPKGHVLPENVEVDLPKATQALTDYGLSPNLFTSNISDVESQMHNNVLRVASQEGFKLYRTNWLAYDKSRTIGQNLKAYNRQLRDLARLNRKLDLCGGYQNHAGNKVGSPVWDLKALLEGINPQDLGVQYDIRHATVEGAHSWDLGFDYIKSNINSLVLKDFKWGVKDGKPTLINTPIGEGMVDFDRFFKLLKKNHINVPISLHFEYDLGGAEYGLSNISMPQKEVFSQMKRDFLKVKELWSKA